MNIIKLRNGTVGNKDEFSHACTEAARLVRELESYSWNPAKTASSNSPSDSAARLKLAAAKE
jgi:hypothetical protein